MKSMTKISQVLLFVAILGHPGAVRRVGSKGATKVISSTGEKAPGPGCIKPALKSPLK